MAVTTTEHGEVEPPPTTPSGNGSRPPVPPWDRPQFRFWVIAVSAIALLAAAMIWLKFSAAPILRVVNRLSIDAAPKKPSFLRTSLQDRITPVFPAEVNPTPLRAASSPF